MRVAKNTGHCEDIIPIIVCKNNQLLKQFFFF